MDGSNCMGLMAVVAVSGSVALVSLQLHKRLTSDFIKKLESEIDCVRRRVRGEEQIRRTKKRVRFASDVIEPSSNNEEYRRRRRAALMLGHCAANFLS